MRIDFAFGLVLLLVVELILLLVDLFFICLCF